jgi:CIC family chloride channel protein
MNESTPNLPHDWLSRLRRRAWFAERFRLSELQITLFLAGLVGLLAALVSIGFRYLTEILRAALTGSAGGYVEAMRAMPGWQRVATLGGGGLAGGLILWLGHRWLRKPQEGDYMEAIIVGDGVVSFRTTLVKCASALFSIASGASIGREGPLVQLSAMIASLVGRWRHIPPVRLRLLVACGAAAGIASAYNAPIGGALFVAEIVLRSLAMESFGPLVFASVVATLASRGFLGEAALYQMPALRLGSNWEMIAHLLLGVLAGAMAPAFLGLLRTSGTLFKKTRLPLALRMTLGGVLVGLIAMALPEVSGNGHGVVNEMLHNHPAWTWVLALLVAKILATSITFGSGAVGGVFTPTLVAGAALGSLFAQALATCWPGAPLEPSTFAMIGMGAFLAATTQAPLMAFLLLFEMTLDYQIILPLMVACVSAHYSCLAFGGKSIYATARPPDPGTSPQPLPALAVSELMKPSPPSVSALDGFDVIAKRFISSRIGHLCVLDENQALVGMISLHDVKSFLNQPDLAKIVIARDLAREDYPRISANATLAEALESFSGLEIERLPVIDPAPPHRLLGTLSRGDLLLAFAERKAGHKAS